MQISENFRLEEFLRSTSHPDIDNNPLPEEKSNIIALVTNVLQPLRVLCNQPLRINSGYRSTALNRAVGGVSTSQHCKGQAADVACKNPKLLLDLMRLNNIEFDQCGIYKNFCHISFRRLGGNRREVFYGKY